MKRLIALFGMFFLSVASAYAGGYTIQTPGQLPTQVNPNVGGGYTVQTPGQLPTQVTPRW